MTEPLNLVIEFSGGAELLFGNVKRHNVQLASDDPDSWTIKKLLVWIEKNLLKERKDLFIQDDSVRPGILVLVNESDWELLGQLNYKLKDNDNVMFISTLHGG